MIKRIINIVFFVALLLLIVPINNAQTPFPTVSVGGNTLPLPGLTCGDGNTTSANKCCTFTTTKPTSNICGGGVFGWICDLVIGRVDGITSPILEAQRQTSVVPCMNGSPSTPGDQNNPACICLLAPTPVPLSALAPLCNKITNSSERGRCVSCSNDLGGVWTSIGCYNGNISAFVGHLLEMGISLAGGISLLCIMFSAFQMQTSSGNPEKIKKAQELLTNCITGLMVIIFSVLILKIIGVDILRIPGFGL